MDKYEVLANLIIDEVSEVALNQHPEIKLMTKQAKEDGAETPSLIYGAEYYILEDKISGIIEKFIEKEKSLEAKNG